MKKISHPTLSPSRFVIALSLVHISFLSPLLAADEIEKGDPHHDKAIRIALSKHNMDRDHFVPREGQTVPLYDIKDHIRHQSAQIHREQLVKHTKRSALVTPTASPEKATQSSPSLLSNLASIPGHILYSPVYLYNMLPNLRSTPQTSSSSPTKNLSSANSGDESEDFVNVKGDTKAKSGSESTAVLTPLLKASAESDPVISIVTNDGDQKDPSPKVASSSLPSTVIHPGEEGSSPSLSSAVRTPYAEGSEGSGTKGTRTLGPILVYSGDGGVVKGLLPAYLITYLEKQTNTPMSEIFHHVIGTSISGVQVLGWTINNGDGKPMMSGADVVKLMETDTDSIFPKSSSWNIPARIFGSISSLNYAQFDPTPFEQRLQGIFGTTTFANARTNVYVPTLVSETNVPLVISSRTHQPVLTWEGARGTSAAPTTFPAYQAKSLPNNPYLLDGGITLNNPGDYILDEVITYEYSLGNHHPEIVMFSAGTGRQPINPVPDNAGLLNGVGPIIEAFTESQVLGTHLTLKQRLKVGETYFRADPKLPYHIPLDALTADYIKTLKEAAETQFSIVDAFIETDAVRKKLEAK